MTADALPLPRSIEMERAILGGLILDPFALAEVEVFIGAGDFFERRNQLIFDAIVSLAADSRPLDFRTLQERLEERGHFDQVGAIPYLAALDQDLPDLSRLGTYARELRKLSTARQVIQLCQVVAGRLAKERDPETARDELLTAQRLLDEATVEISGGPFAGRVASAAARYRAIKSGDRQAGLRTGFRHLDEELVGFGRRELILLAGYAGSGKTTFVEQLVDNWVRGGERVLLVHLEMGEDQTEDRQFGRIMKRPPKDLRAGRFIPEELERAEAELAAADWTHRLVEIHPQSTEIGEVSSQVRAAFRQQPYDVLVIDHLMELSSKRARDRRSEVSDAVKACKDLARELDVPVLVPVQMSREGGRQAVDGKRPRLWHLGESSELERRADTVLMFWAPDDDKPLRRLGIEKARQGERGFEIEYQMNPHSRVYSEVGPAYAPGVGGDRPF